LVGAGPVGLLLTASLQSLEGFAVRLYEKRHLYTYPDGPARAVPRGRLSGELPHIIFLYGQNYDRSQFARDGQQHV